MRVTVCPSAWVLFAHFLSVCLCALLKTAFPRFLFWPIWDWLKGEATLKPICCFLLVKPYNDRAFPQGFNILMYKGKWVTQWPHDPVTQWPSDPVKRNQQDLNNPKLALNLALGISMIGKRWRWTIRPREINHRQKNKPRWWIVLGLGMIEFLQAVNLKPWRDSQLRRILKGQCLL